MPASLNHSRYSFVLPVFNEAAGLPGEAAVARTVAVGAPLIDVTTSVQRAAQ
jgi:hypothetical protein